MVYYIYSSDSNNVRKISNFNVSSLSGTECKQSHRSIPICTEDRSNIDDFYTPAEETESESNISKKRLNRRKTSLKSDKSKYTYCIETKDCYNSNVYDAFTNSLNQKKFPGTIRYNNNPDRKVPLYTENNMRNLGKQIKFSIDKPKQTWEMKNPENKCNRAEKMTYCRPVTEYNNEKYVYKTLADKRKLHRLLKEMIKARVRENQKAAWDDYIHQLRMKHTKKDEPQPTTSKSLHPPDAGIDMDILEDSNNTRFKTAPSNHCKTLLHDLYSSSIDTNKFPMRSYANANIFGNNNQNDVPNENRCEFTPVRNVAMDNNSSFFSNNLNQYLGSPTTSQHPYFIYPCSSSGRLMKLSKLAVLNSCDLGYPKRRLSRYNNKSNRESSLESRLQRRNNSINKTKLISRSYGNRSMSSKSKKYDAPTKYNTGRSDSSQDRNRKPKDNQWSKNKKYCPRQQCTRTDDLVEVFTSDSNQNRNCVPENKQTSKNSCPCPIQQTSTRADDSVEVSRQNKQNFEREKETKRNLNAGVNTCGKGSGGVSRQNKQNCERNKETNFNRNTGGNTFVNAVKKLKSTDADDSIVSTNKSNHERETKMTPSLNQNSFKNIEDKLDILITQMNALLGKSELLNVHQCPCKSKNIDQSATNKPISKEGTCCRTRMLQAIFNTEESVDLNLNFGHNNKNNKEQAASKITEQTTNESAEHKVSQTYSGNVDITDGNNNNNKTDTSKVEENVNKSLETENDSKNNIVYNKDNKLIFVTISNKSTSTSEASRASNVSKIDEILLEEIDKSDKVKRDIESILNGNVSNQCNVQNIFEEPTRDCGTEVTKSLSTTKIDDDSSIESTELVAVYANNPNDRLTMAVNTDPLGLLSLLNISKAAIGRLLSFVNFDYQSLFPSPIPRPLNRPAIIAFNCTMCKSSFQKSTEFSEHIIKAHKAQPSKDCCVCRHMLEKGVSRMIRSTLFKCRYCSQNFTRAYCCELHEQCCSRRRGLEHDVPENLAFLS